MTRCLREYTLVVVYIGEGTNEERSHLASCNHCSQRYQHLVRDWQRIANILQTAPPPRTHSRPSLLFTQSWVPIMTALAAAVLLIMVQVRGWQPTPSFVTHTTPAEEAVSFVETTVPVLFADDSPLSDDTLVVPVLFADDSSPSDDTLASLDPLTSIADDSDEAYVYVQATLDGEEWP